MPSVEAVVLAGGTSARMGRQKLLLDVGGVPMLERVLVTLRSSKVDRIVVVLGEDEAAIRRGVAFEDEKIVVNADSRGGMSSSLRVGLGGVSEDAGSAMVVLADQPFVRPETIDGLVDVHVRTGASIVAPFYRGRRGNPVLFARSMFPSLMLIEGDQGGRALIEANSDRMAKVEVDDAGVVEDVDTLGDYERLAAGRDGGVSSGKRSQGGG